MTATLLHVRNPVAPDLGARHFAIAAGLTVSEALAESGWTLPATTVLMRDGALTKWSDDRPIVEGEIVGMVTVPRGGQSGGSNVLMVVAELALIVAAFAIAGPWGGGAAVAGMLGVTSATGIAAVTAVVQTSIMIAGNLLLSVIIPPPSQPRIPPGAQAYGLQPQSNLARLGQPKAERKGRRCIWPDLASAPYTEFDDNNQQIMFERFELGMGEFDITQMRVADTVIWEGGTSTGTYPDLEVEIVPPGGTHILVPETALMSSEVSNIHLLGSDETGWDFTPSFTLNPPRTQAVAWGIDMSWPGGLNFTGSDGERHEATVDFYFQAREIDDLGNVVGDWIDILGSAATPEEITALSYVPIQKSYKGTFATAARYQIRGIRTDTAGSQGNHANATYWVGLRAYFDNVTSYADVTTIGLKARASSGLNGSTAQQFNVICTRKLPFYDIDSATWSANTATRSIAAAASYLMRSDNGLKLPDSRIDLDTLWQLEETWVERGDTFDGGFLDRKSGWEALQDILGCGRTRPVMAGPKITFVRDEPRAAPVTAFTPAQMLPNTFKNDYVLHDSNPTDALLAIFIDEGSWTQNQVLCALPGSTLTEDDAPQLMVDFMVNSAQVFRETMYRVAASFYRRVFPSFSTKADGRVILFGSPVRIAHHVAQWGTTALAVKLSRSDLGDVLTLSEPLTPSEDPPYKATLLAPDGRVYGPVNVALLDDGRNDGRARVRLMESFDIADGNYAGMAPRDWGVWSGKGLQKNRPKVVLGTVTEQPIDALTVSTTPQKDPGYGTDVVCVRDDSRVYTADGTDGLGGDGDTGGGDGGLDLTITDIQFGQTFPAVVQIQFIGAPDNWSFQYELKYDGGTYGSPQESGPIAAVDPRPHTTLQVKARAKAWSAADGVYYYGDWFESDVFDLVT